MSRLAALLARIEDYAGLPCVWQGGITHGYAALQGSIRQWRDRLHAAQVEAGSVVALRGEHSIAAYGALLALLERRTIAALLPRDSDPLERLAACRATWFIDADAAAPDVIAVPPPAGLNPPLLESLRNSGDGGLVIFTSGTTGKPKAALQSTERFLSKFDTPGRRMRTLAFLLFDHVAGIDTLFYTLRNGGCLVTVAKRDPGTVLSAIESAQVQVLPASPSFLRLMSLGDESRDRDLSSLEIITYGSEPMDPATLGRLNLRFPDIRLEQKYGTTETGSPRTISRGNDSLWVRLKDPNVETRVVDGKLWIRSESTILGYLDAPSPIGDDGWYDTGDRVEVDGDWLRFLGRASETINVGGEKVSPTTVEQAILELDFVREALVRPSPHPLMGQVVAATVVLDAADAPPDALRVIRRHCALRLLRHQIPVTIDAAPGPLVGSRQKLQRGQAPAR